MSAAVCMANKDNVLESTAADFGSSSKTMRFEAPISELSAISPTDTHIQVPCVNQNKEECSPEKLQVFLRIRPLTDTERERGEDQGCVLVQSEDTLLLKAPKDSHTMKSAERGITQSVHKFTFTQIFGAKASQQETYEQTMKEMVRDVLLGENRLLYTYGVTNSGKTFTIQGSANEAGLLPRALFSIFNTLTGRLYKDCDLKPVLKHEVRQLSKREVCTEEEKRNVLLREEEVCRQRGGSVSVSWDSGISGLSAFTRLEDSDGVCVEVDAESLNDVHLDESQQFSIWVSFYEIYNEFIYDLLELSTHKRNTLRLSDDKHGSVYVKDLTWVNVRSADEAWRILSVGRNNQSFATTHLNHNSSRSHSVFTVRVLQVHRAGAASRISELCVCDLAGSERSKDQQNGERMKEANNINTSLLTLGRCISAMRHNQNYRQRAPQVIPFRDSKLTRVLQSYFTGHGRASMMVNINSCSSSYDETLHALKFSAIATQLVHSSSSNSRVAYILSLLREDMHTEDTAVEEEEDSDDEDVSMYEPEELVKAINVLKREILRQRKEREEVEQKIREQVCSEMMDIINQMQQDFSETLENERDLMEKRCENKINNLKSSLRKYYSQELEEQEEQIRELTAVIEQKEANGGAAQMFPSLTEPDGVRRSQRLASTHKRISETKEQETLHQIKAELEECRAELDLKNSELRLKTLEMKRFQDHQSSSSLATTAERKLIDGQKTLRQLRADLHAIVVKLQSGERACCHYTDGEKLRTALSTADTTLLKQDQMLMELHSTLQLMKAQLLHHREETHPETLRHPAIPNIGTTPSSCRRRGCGAAMAMVENAPPVKRSFLQLFTSSNSASKSRSKCDPSTPYERILRSRQPSPPPSPALTRARPRRF